MDRLLRLAPLVLALAGCVLMLVAEFMPLIEIRIITVVHSTITAGEHHGYALAVIAVAAALMAWGANIGDSRPAAFALLGLAIAALVVVLAVDLPDIDETGLTKLYEQATASPRIGFYLESLGAVLLLLGAAATFLLGRPSSAASREPLASREPREPRDRKAT